MSLTRSAPVTTARRPAWRSKQLLSIGKLAAAHLVLLVGAVAMAVPFLWMIDTALTPGNNILSYPPRLAPSAPVVDNFVQIFQIEPFSLYLTNSLTIAVLSTIGHVLTCAMAAFAFARLRFPGRDALFMLVLAAMMIPYQVTMIPVFVLMKSLGWVNTFLPLIVPSWIGGPFGTFMLRQFFLTIPPELSDAAKIDGSNFYGIFGRIYLPLSGPALATLAVFTFMWSWNDLLGPLIYLNTPTKYTVSIGLAYFQSHFVTWWGQMMAAALVSLIPIMLIFLLAQKYFVQGIATTGLRQ